MSQSTSSNEHENSAGSGDSVLLFRGKNGIVVNQTDKDETRSSGEEAWTEEAETLAISWADRAADKSKAHQISAAKNGKLHIAFGLPTVLLPVIFAAISPQLEDISGGNYAIMGSYILIAIFNGVSGFFNFEKRKTENESFSARFGEIVADVRFQMFKSRRFRTPSDEFLMKTTTRLNALIEQEPPIA